MVGSDGVVGASAALDGRMSVSLGVVQLAGEILVCSIDGLRSTASQSPNLLSLLIRHEQTVYAQAQQSAACFASHHMQARLCRWLLRARDLSGTDTLLFTQEYLAENAGREAKQRDCRRSHSTECGPDKIRPRKDPNPLWKRCKMARASATGP